MPDSFTITIPIPNLDSFSAKVGCPVALELAFKPGDAEKRSGAEESVLARHAPRDLQQCMASSANATQKTTQTRKISTLSLPPSPLPPTPPSPRTSAKLTQLNYFCSLAVVVLRYKCASLGAASTICLTGGT